MFQGNHVGFFNRQFIESLSVSFGGGGIIEFFHYRKHDLMPLIICKNAKHFVTLYNVLILNRQEGSNVLLKLNVLDNLSV